MKEHIKQVHWDAQYYPIAITTSKIKMTNDFYIMDNLPNNFEQTHKNYDFSN